MTIILLIIPMKIKIIIQYQVQIFPVVSSMSVIVVISKDGLRLLQHINNVCNKAPTFFFPLATEKEDSEPTLNRMSYILDHMIVFLWYPLMRFSIPFSCKLGIHFIRFILNMFRREHRMCFCIPNASHQEAHSVRLSCIQTVSLALNCDHLPFQSLSC